MQLIKPKGKSNPDVMLQCFQNDHMFLKFASPAGAPSGNGLVGALDALARGSALVVDRVGAGATLG